MSISINNYSNKKKSSIYDHKMYLNPLNNKLIKILIANDNQLVIEVNVWLGDQNEKCKYTRRWQKSNKNLHWIPKSLTHTKNKYS